MSHGRKRGFIIVEKKRVQQRERRSKRGPNTLYRGKKIVPKRPQGADRRAYKIAVKVLLLIKKKGVSGYGGGKKGGDEQCGRKNG